MYSINEYSFNYLTLFNNQIKLLQGSAHLHCSTRPMAVSPLIGQGLVGVDQGLRSLTYDQGLTNDRWGAISFHSILKLLAPDWLGKTALALSHSVTPEHSKDVICKRVNTILKARPLKAGDTSPTEKWN